MSILGAGPIYLGSQLIAPAPTPLPAPYAWWDFSDTSTITDTGGTINSVTDKSGNGFTLTGSGTVQTGVDTIGGLNVATFGGGYLNYNGATGINVGAVTIICVVQQTTNTEFAGILSIKPSSGSDDNSTSGCNFNCGSNSIQAIFERNGAPNGGSGLPGSGNTALGVYAASAGVPVSQMFKSASPSMVTGLIHVGSSFTEALGGFLAGGRYQSSNISAGFRFQGYMAEIRVFDSTLSLDEIGAISDHLVTKWSL